MNTRRFAVYHWTNRPTARGQAAILSAVMAGLLACGWSARGATVLYMPGIPDDKTHRPDAVGNGWSEITPNNPANINKNTQTTFGLNNQFDSQKKKHVEITLKGTLLNQASAGITGYGGRNDPAGTGTPSKSNFQRNDNEGILNVSFNLDPQPSWEYITLKALKEGVSVTSASAKYGCYTTLNVEKNCKQYGDLKDPPSAISVTEFWIFPTTIRVDTSATPLFAGGTGTWNYQFVTTDPYGNQMPLGGIKWTNTGGALGDGVQYAWSLDMTGTADRWYQQFAYDANSTEIDKYWSFQTECVPLPAAGWMGASLLAGLGGLSGLKRIRRYNF